MTGTGQRAGLTVQLTLPSSLLSLPLASECFMPFLESKPFLPCPPSKLFIHQHPAEMPSPWKDSCSPFHVLPPYTPSLTLRRAFVIHLRAVSLLKK